MTSHVISAPIPGRTTDTTALTASGPPVVELPRQIRRPMNAAVLHQLLRSAVALQAEDLLRTVGALAGAWRSDVNRAEWIERDARDLGALAAAAVAAGAALPAGLDAGAGDPDEPGTVAEGLLAGHEALVHVLRQLAACADENSSWAHVVRGILDRQEEEILMLQAVGACGVLPDDEAYVHGALPGC